MTNTTDKRPAWATFASIMMFGLGGIALTVAIADFVNDSWVGDQSRYELPIHILSYGIFDGLIGLAALYAGFDIWRGGKVGYWLAIIFATLSAIRWFIFIPAVPLAALVMIGIWILVIYGLAKSSWYFDLGGL